MAIDDDVEGAVGVERKAVACHEPARLHVARELVEDGLLKKAKDADGLEKVVEVVVEAAPIVFCASRSDVGVEIEALILGRGLGTVMVENVAKIRMRLSEASITRSSPSMRAMSGLRSSAYEAAAAAVAATVFGRRAGDGRCIGGYGGQ
ncbi:hypothetical protein L1887_59475 [Cichorium endivia]|nr:hypothetical protein L1887_59475 [Cichorium endivia]